MRLRLIDRARTLDPRGLPTRDGPTLWALVMAGILSLPGCASVTFKAGASPGKMAADESACRERSEDEAAYVLCMRDLGWFVASPDANSKPPVVGDEVVATQAVPQPTPVGALGPKPVVAPTVAAPASPSVATPERSSTVAQKEGPPDTQTSIEVSSWWKLFGNAADLDKAIAACVTGLGAEQEPKSGGRVVTVAMYHCLRKAGWRPLGETRRE